MKKPVFGVGINDVNYQVCFTDNTGKKTKCVFYSTWIGMLMRCYSKHYLDKFPTFKGCTVCEEWKYFSNFKAWMETQDYVGKELDKDIIKIGNKTYSPDTCCFITQKLNSLLTRPKILKRILPPGVTKHRRRFRAYVKYNSKPEFLGSFTTIKEAFYAYTCRKIEIIQEAAIDQPILIKNGLNDYCNLLQLEFLEYLKNNL